MTTVETFERASDTLPEGGPAHWLIRIPLAAIIFQQGLLKFPLSADAAAAYDLPLVLWALSAVGEIGAATLLIIGGFFRNWVGDLATRVAGAGIALIVVGVLIVAYAAPIIDILLFNQLHVLLLVGGLFFAFRGKHA